MPDEPTSADELARTLADADDPPPTLHDEHGTVAFADVPPEPETIAAGSTVEPSSAPEDVPTAFEPAGALDKTEAATGVADPVGAHAAETVFGVEENDLATQAGPGAARPTIGLAHLSPRSVCGRYVLKEFYAKGGMGEVWLAEDPEIGRPVALKRILGDRPDQRRRFRVEAQITGRLEHPGIVPVHELGTGAGGDPFYVMKFVQGRTLKKVIEEFHADDPTRDAGAREVEQVRLLQMFLSLCQTVGYAHSRGVLHRDLKPDNVMLGPYGETILLDWGIAKVLSQAEPVGDETATHSAPLWQGDAPPITGTHAGAVMGTPSYMAPEVAAGRNDEVDERSDIYLLGATLYEILTGRQPRTAKTVFEMIQKAEHEPPKPARSVNPLVPKALDAVCLKAMAHRKEDRYPSASSLADDVQRFIAGEPVSAYREDALTRAWRWARRHRKGLGRAAAVVVIGGLALLAVSKVRDAERRRIEATRQAEVLKARDQARRDLKEFRRLADEARFYAATTEPVTEHAPYYDPHKGEAAATAALALASKWGPTLEGLPLPEERASVKSEYYDLLLLSAYVKDRRDESPRVVVEILDRAERLTEPTAGAFRLRARAYDRLGDANRAALMRWRADDPKTPKRALDHFLAGERERTESPAKVGEQTDFKPWEPDPARLESAIDEYRRALAIDPDHFWLRLQLGRCYQGLGRFAEATEALGACVAIRPDSPWGYTALGLSLAQQGRYAEAEDDLNRAILLGPDTRPARLHRGVTFWRQKKYDQALADFEAVLAPPDDRRLVEAAYYRGQLYLERGALEKALDDFNRVVAAIPGFRPVYLDRPLIYLARNDPAHALTDLDSYIALSRPIDPKGWELHGLRGRLLLNLYKELPLGKRAGPTGRAMLPLAEAELLKAVTMGGKAAGLFDDLGAVREHSGQLGFAVVAYTQGLKIAPDNPKLLIKRAWAYDQLNQREKALADFTAAARADPENAEAHTGLGYVQALRKLPPDAQRQADLALLHGADKYLVLHNVACIYAALSPADGAGSTADQDVAVALLRRSVKLWKQGGTGPNEYTLIKGESAFKPLQDRKDFQELLRGDDTAPAPQR